jgi:hypothetical protein
VLTSGQVNLQQLGELCLFIGLSSQANPDWPIADMNKKMLPRYFAHRHSL